MAISKGLGSEQIEIVGQAGDGVSALDLFKQTDPDFVTMDITMPHLDGLSCLEEMIKLKSSVKILVITALTNDGLPLQALKKGARGFLNKPFTPEKLRDAFSKMINP